MSDEIVQNDQLVLISGESGTGKSASLRNIRNQEKWLYMNCESGKRLPFKNNFEQRVITNPNQVLEYFDQAIEHQDKLDGIIIDTLTFLMDMYESKLVLPAKDTMKGWSNYQQFFKKIMQDKIPNFRKPVIILAHTRDSLDEGKMEMKTAVPIKGALQGNGIEAFFSTVVSTKKIALSELDKYKSELLNITEEETIVGFKHVFQTKITKKTTGERIRSPLGMFSTEQTYMDNNAQLLLDYLTDYYK